MEQAKQAYEAVQEEKREIIQATQEYQQEKPVDFSKIPPNGPYIAFLGNLPYGINDAGLEKFFQGLNVRNEQSFHFSPFF